MTAPMMAPIGFMLPLLSFSTMSGLAARASSTAFSRAPSSDTTWKPCFLTTSSGVPSPASTPATVCLASLSLSLPSAINFSTSATSAGVIGSSSRLTPLLLASRLSSPSHHFLAPAAEAPALTVSSSRSRASALSTSRISRSLKPHSPFRRLRRSRGISGIWAFISSMCSLVMCSITRSGSGK